MKIIQESSDKAVLREMGQRIALARLNQNRTQAWVAKEAGISLRTMARVESGASVQLINIIRVFRTLGVLVNFEALLPESQISPIQQFQMRGKTRKRASSESSESSSSEPWSWGDE